MRKEQTIRTRLKKLKDQLARKKTEIVWWDNRPKEIEILTWVLNDKPLPKDE